MKIGMGQQGSLPENDRSYNPENGLRILAHIIAVRLTNSPAADIKRKELSNQPASEDKAG
jgi:hypothetical protein